MDNYADVCGYILSFTGTHNVMKVRMHAPVTTLVVVGVLLTGVYLYRVSHPAPPDPLLVSTFEKASQVFSYAQEDRTEALVGDRRLVIRGTYLVDRARNRYASVSTTTVYAPPQKTGQSFTLSNISIGSDVFSRMETGGVAPGTSVPASSQWHRFSSNAIPEEYLGIAVPGPLLDQLRLFAEKGSYLDFVERLPANPPSDGLVGYRFKLSGRAPPSPGGTLEALIQHVGTGTIDAWIDPQDATIRSVIITNVGYRATTSLSRFDETLDIEPPAQ